jgi:hypothetical protein
MKRLLVAFVLTIALAWSVQFHTPVRAQAIGPYVQAACSQLASFTGTATTVLAIAGAAGKVLYLCGYQFTATAATTAAVVYGTGATCGTGTTAVTGALNVATTPTTDHQQYAYFNVPQIQPFATATQNSLCVTIGTAAVTGHLFVGQY